MDYKKIEKLEPKHYPITIGVKGIDNYSMKLATGEEFPHPTDEELAEYDRLYPRDLEWEKSVKEGREEEYLKKLGLL